MHSDGHQHKGQIVNHCWYDITWYPNNVYLLISFFTIHLFRLALEAKLQENDRRKIDEEAHRHAEREKMEDRISAANDAKNVAEREVLVLKLVYIDWHKTIHL